MNRKNFHVQEKDLRLTQFEISTFLHNAQLALCEYVPDETIPTVYYYKNELVQCFQGSTLPPVQLACVLVSAAWDIYAAAGEKHEDSPVGR